MHNVSYIIIGGAVLFLAGAWVVGKTQQAIQQVEAKDVRRNFQRDAIYNKVIAAQFRAARKARLEGTGPEHP